MHTYLLDLLACPACHGDLAWTIDERTDERILEAEASCEECGKSYPVREGIACFLTGPAGQEDLWAQAESHLSQHLNNHPEIECQLLESPLEDLEPADCFFRAMVLEERGRFAEARSAEAVAHAGLYTPEYLSCQESQFKYLLGQLSQSNGPIVDLASGRGYLVERMLQSTDRHVVASDLSISVLRGNQMRFEHQGLYGSLSLLAFDVRQAPFKTSSVEMLTTNQGLANIRVPGNMLAELRRVAKGSFLGITHFYPETDANNARVIREHGLGEMLYGRSALEHFRSAGWEAQADNLCIAPARPTPSGVILEGAQIDLLPAVETLLEWCVLAASTAG